MKSMLTAALMALAIMPAGAQTHNRGDHAAAEKALNAWANCASDAIARLDDGRSDAASIAHAVTVECRIKRDILLNLMAVDMLSDPNQFTPTARREWLAEMKAGDLDLVTSMVLDYRAALRRQRR